MSRDELEQLNWTRTRALVTYAARKVPFYRTYYAKAGFDPRELKEPSDFRHVPVLRREHIRDHFHDLVSEDARAPHDFNLLATGGSTGEPLKVYHAKRVIRIAMFWRMLAWWNIPMGCDFASVYRETRTSWKATMRDRLLWWPGRRVQLDARCLDEDAMRRFLQELARVRPPLLHGYVGGVDTLASFMLEEGISVPPPKAVWLTSSPFSAVQSRRIEEAFGAPAYDQYGSCEVFYLAAQCAEKRGLHMFHDTRRIEFLDESYCPRPVGEYGQVAITDLLSADFPFIRYLNGDQGRALPGECPCGCSLPVMDHVRGRVSDCLRLPGGAVLNGSALTTIFDDHPDAVSRFQVHQSSDYQITVRVVATTPSAPPRDVLREVQRMLETWVKGEVPVRMELVESIDKDRDKLRFVVSEVADS